jgi:hypothetical protein
MRVWKLRSSLTTKQCEDTWRSAEKVNQYGMYSKFGDSYPTLDVSLSLLDPRLSPVFDNLIQELGNFVVDKFLMKLDTDGDEMRHKNGSAFFDKSQNYMNFLSLKGYFINIL